jgi:hypothetical protein
VHRITSSKERRTQHNPLFAVNLMELLLRHGSANHRRETIAFSKRRQAAIERLAIVTVWRDYIKKRREKAACPAETAAMRAGVIDKALTWRDVLRRRLFFGQVSLPQTWKRYYRRQVKTAVFGDRQLGHACRYAF